MAERIIQKPLDSTPNPDNDFIIVDSSTEGTRRVSVRNVANTGGPVTSVNGETGDVVIDADEIDDTSTVKKLVTTVQLNKIEIIKTDQGTDTVLHGDGIYRTTGINDAANIGTGVGVFSSIASSQLQFKTLVDGTYVKLDATSDEIAIDDSSMISYINSQIVSSGTNGNAYTDLKFAEAIVQSSEYTDQAIYEFGTSGVGGADLTASNGLTKVGDDIQLGGSLTDDLVIDATGFDVTIEESDNMTLTSNGNFNFNADNNVTLRSNGANVTVYAHANLNLEGASFSLKGLGPSSPSTQFFRADGVWAEPAGSGGSGFDGTAGFAHYAAVAYHIDDGDSLTDGDGDGIIISVGYASTSGYALNSGLLNSQAGSYYLDRTNHTGTQSVSTLSDFTTEVQELIDTSIDAIVFPDASTAGYALNSGLLNNQSGSHYLNRTNHTGTQTVSTISDFYTGMLSGTSGYATNSGQLNSQAPSYYLSRTNHTDSQTASTISDFSSATDTRINLKVSGTSNTVAKFTATNVVGNSSITDNGTTVAITGNETVSGTLAVTGASTLTGNVTCVGNLIVQGQAYAEQGTLTYNATQAWNLDTNPNAVLTLTGNSTLQNPTNMKAGGTYYLIAKQDGTGSRTLAYGSAYKWGSGVAPILSTALNSVDIITFISDGTNMYGSIIKAFA